MARLLHPGGMPLQHRLPRLSVPSQVPSRVLVRRLARRSPSQQARAPARASLQVQAAKDGFEEALSTQRLVSQLHSPDPAICSKAALTISKMAAKDAQDASAAIAAGALAPLVHMLEKDAGSAKHAAVMALANLANPEHFQAIAAAGAISPLVALLKSGSAAESVAVALCNLSGLEANAQAIAEAGAAAPLAQLLLSGGGGALAAAAVLCRPAVVAASGSEVVRAGGIPALVQLLDGTPSHFALTLASGLCTLAATEPCAIQAAAPALVQLLQAGSVNAQSRAIAVLGKVTASADPAVLRVIVSAGAIGPLMALLASPHQLLKQAAVAVLGNLARVEELSLEVARLGAVRPIVDLLSLHSGAEVEAALALANLESKGDTATAIIQAGAAPLLVKLLSEGSDTARVAAAAAACNLSSKEASGVALVGAGAIPPLVQLLRQPSAEGNEHAAGAIANLTRESRDHSLAVMEGGGLTPLVQLFVSPSSSHAVVKEAGKALCDMSTSSEVAAQLVATYGVALFVRLLLTGSAAAVEQAAGVLGNMATEQNLRPAVAEAGAIPAAISLLVLAGEARPVGLGRERVAAMLANLAGSAEIGGAIIRAGGVPVLLGQLQALDAAAQYSLGALHNLAVQSRGSREAFTGAVGPLVRAWREGTGGVRDTAHMVLEVLAEDRATRKAIAEAGGPSF